MSTVKANINTSSYVKVNQGRHPVLLQAQADAVRLVFSDTQPAASNNVFHLITADKDPLPIPFNDTNIWAMATSNTCSLFITEFSENNPNGITQDGKTAFVTEFGELTVGQRIDDISVNFHYGISTRDTVDDSSGTGSVSEVGSDAAVQCGTGVGEGSLVSIDAVRYRSGHECITMITHDQTELQSGVDVMHGIINGEDGIAIGSQDTDMGLWFVEGNNENFIAQGAFTVDNLDGTGPSSFTIDMTKRNLFAITFGYLSIAPIRFYVHSGDKGWILFHCIVKANTQAEGHLKNPTLPVSCIVRRASGSGDDVQVKMGSWRAGSVGSVEEESSASNRWFDQRRTVTNLASIDTGANPDDYHALFTLRNKTSFNGMINHVRAEIAIVAAAIDANKSVEIIGLVNATLVGDAGYNDRDTNNSVMEVSLGGTATGNFSEGSSVLGKESTFRESIRNTGAYIRPGQTITYAVRGVNGSAVVGDISAVYRWFEEF